MASDHTQAAQKARADRIHSQIEDLKSGKMTGKIAANPRTFIAEKMRESEEPENDRAAECDHDAEKTK